MIRELLVKGAARAPRHVASARGAGRPTRRAGTSLLSAVLLLAGMTTVGVITATPARAGTDPAHINFTLEGCRGDAGLFAINGPFVCPDALYTTGNLGKGWNELDLVPHRLTTSAGTAPSTTTTYTIAIVADGSRNGAPGYDFISVPVTDDAGCSISAGNLLTETPGFGGADSSIYRLVTITQQPGSTCVFDYYQRLALGSSAFSGSSLQSNLGNQNLGSQGIGEKRVSIPDTPAPQTISKDMTASRGSDHIWTVGKSPSPASLSFGDTCAPGATRTRNVTIRVTWTKGAASPNGDVTVVTHVYATNPAHRPVQLSVTDQIFAGTTSSGTVLDTSSSGLVTVPANTTNVLVLTHQTTLPAGATAYSDLATGTYTDPVSGLPPISLTRTATATADVQLSGPELNQSATISDVESITGAGLTFSVATPSVGSFTGGYMAGTPTTGPVGWSSGSQSSSGYVDFVKTVYLDQPRITTGSLSDTATLAGSDGASASADLSVGITSTATVSLTINKTIPIVLGAGDSTQTFTFPVTGTGYASSPTISFGSGDGGALNPKSTTLTGLAPGTYNVAETTLAPYIGQASHPVTITLPSCSGSTTFTNEFGLASAQVRKVTVPAGSEAGWVMTLTGPGTPIGGESVTTTGTGYTAFSTQLQEGSYTVTETPQAGWDQTGSTGCSFTVNYPADADAVFSCTFTNTRRGSITIIKNAVPDDAQDFGYTTSGSGLSSFSLDDDADPTLSNTRTFTNLVPGSYSVTETLPVTGWDLTALSCSSTNGSSTTGTNLGTGVSSITLGAGDSVTCRYTNTKRGHVTVHKTENGGTPTTAYTFRLTGGPDNVNLTQTTSAGNGGDLDFGLLKPGSYTLCELAVPAGTHSTLEDQGGTLNTTTGDVCLTFTLTAGETRAFSIDNSRPGGGQRTIGYWKNWSSCSTTGNNRVAMAAKTGNHLMDEFLPITLGSYTVDTCAKGLAVLQAASGKYAENQLAAQLLAAKLNVKAGASSCQTVSNAISHGDALLTQINYVGPPSQLVGSGNSLRSDVLATASTLDRYNNGLIC
jgi:hypothetical protein